MAVVINTPPASSQRFSWERPAPTREAARVEPTSNQEFLATVLDSPKRFHYSSSSELYVVTESGCERARYGVSSVSLGFQAIHQAFASHTALSLRPDTLWYMIVHEVAEHVRQNSEQYASLFTDTPEAKQTIEVRDDSLSYDAPSDWGRTITLFRAPLKEKLTDYTADLFLPRFSTSTIEDETTLLVALMDVASPYYEYVVSTRCGIPQIKLEGEPQDWKDLFFRTEMLARDFPDLGDYFNDLLSVLRTIAETAAGAAPNESFWRSIYKYENESGGPYVTGWITAFFAFIQTDDGRHPKEEYDWERTANAGWGGYRTNQFPAHVSKVPFIWDYYGTKYEMAFAAGVTSVGFEDEFLTPKLGFAVVEV